MDWDLEYGELSKDKEFVANCENLKANLMDVQKTLDQLLPLRQQYDKLSLPEQIELDLFFVYTLNSLHWIHLRINGVDTSNHPITGELQRIKAAMKKWQEVKDRNKRPTLDIEAAKRFVRSGLYDPCEAAAQTQNKKMKFTDDDD